jgi:hypothetical protein
VESDNEIQALIVYPTKISPFGKCGRIKRRGVRVPRRYVQGGRVKGTQPLAVTGEMLQKD